MKANIVLLTPSEHLTADELVAVKFGDTPHHMVPLSDESAYAQASIHVANEFAAAGAKVYWLDPSRGQCGYSYFVGNVQLHEAIDFRVVLLSEAR